LSLSVFTHYFFDSDANQNTGESMPRKNHIQTAALLLSAFALGGQALAHSGAMGIVKERMDSMATLGDYAKAVGDMLKGKTAFEVSVV